MDFISLLFCKLPNCIAKKSFVNCLISTMSYLFLSRREQESDSIFETVNDSRVLEHPKSHRTFLENATKSQSACFLFQAENAGILI